MHHFFLVLFQKRQLVYLFCAIMFTLSALSASFQPYFPEVYEKRHSVALMVLSVLIGISYTGFLRHYAPHKKLH